MTTDVVGYHSHCEIITTSLNKVVSPIKESVQYAALYKSGLDEFP